MSMPDPDSFELVMLINRLAALLHKNIDLKLKPYGLARTQYLVLYYLHTCGGSLPTKELVAKLQVEPATLSSIIDTVESKGLVTRVEFAADKRRKIIELTAAGRKLFESIPIPRAEMEQVLRRDIDPDDVHIIRAVGQQMLTNLEAELQKQEKV